MQLDQLSPKSEGKDAIRAVIETCRGSRNKFSYDPNEQVFTLKKMLPEGHVFPFDFGFIPQTKGEDGDPFDVLVLLDEPAFPGCVVECRLIGVVRAKQSKEGKMLRNDRFLAVARTSQHYRRIRTAGDLDPEMLEQIQQFFVSYQEQLGNKFKIEAVLGAPKARQLIARAVR